ncbi:hypothetical protein C2S52_007099 [Perilla frutescens var. hirtella]|nr:hypothetical protein C2S52_007099 [Perilla frutescens var. hirtella]
MDAPGAKSHMMYPPDCYQYPSYSLFLPSPHGFSYGSSPQMPPKLMRIVRKDGESTPSSGQGSSPLGIESINLERDFDDEAEQNVTQQKRKLDQFWIRVAKEFNKNHPPNTPLRLCKAMKTHFYMTQRSVSVFNAEYISVKQGWRSDHNDQDILMEVLKKWEHNHNRQSFKLLAMWQILRDCPKWNNLGDRDHHGKKKMKTSMSGAYTPSSNNDDDVEERVRPIDQKATKKKEKGKDKAKTGDAPSLHDVQSMISSNIDKYIQIQERRNEQLKYHNKVSEWYILTKDTSKMDSTTLLAHNIMVEEIKKKWGMQ